MRTDDPIGVLILPRNSVTLTLWLMRLGPPALAGRVTFRNRARLTRESAGDASAERPVQRVDYSPGVVYMTAQSIPVYREVECDRETRSVPTQ